MVMEKLTQTPGLAGLGATLSPKTPQESLTTLTFDYQKEEDEAEQFSSDYSIQGYGRGDLPRDETFTVMVD